MSLPVTKISPQNYGIVMKAIKDDPSLLKFNVNTNDNVPGGFRSVYLRCDTKLVENGQFYIISPKLKNPYQLNTNFTEYPKALTGELLGKTTDGNWTANDSKMEEFKQLIETVEEAFINSSVDKEGLSNWRGYKPAQLSKVKDNELKSKFMDNSKKRIVKFTYNDDGVKIYNPKLNLSLRPGYGEDKKPANFYRFKIFDQYKKEKTLDSLQEIIDVVPKGTEFTVCITVQMWFKGNGSSGDCGIKLNVEQLKINKVPENMLEGCMIDDDDDDVEQLSGQVQNNLMIESEDDDDDDDDDDDSD